MNTYYHLHKINEGVYLITEPCYTEYANSFLIESRGQCLLIDCGLGLVNIKEFLHKKRFESIRVTITHDHFDHIGGLKFFAGDEILLFKHTKKNLLEKTLLGIELLKAEDLDTQTLARFGTTSEDFVKTYTVTIPRVALCKKDHIAVGEYVFKVIPAPGHTDDSVLFFEEKKKILISGDALYNGERYDFFPNSDKKAYVETLAMIEDLDFDLLLPGHNDLLTKKQASKIIKKWITELEQKNR